MPVTGSVWPETVLFVTSNSVPSMAWKVKYGYRQVPNFVVSCKDRDDEVLFSSEYFQITRKIEGCPWAPIGCGMGSVGAGLKPAPATRTHLQATPWAPHSRSRRADQASIPGPRGRANAFIASVNDTWLRRLTLECMPALAGRLLPQIAAQVLLSCNQMCASLALSEHP